MLRVEKLSNFLARRRVQMEFIRKSNDLKNKKIVLRKLGKCNTH